MFNKAEEEEHGANTASTGVAGNFGFFEHWWGFFMFLPHQYQHGDHHDSLLLHMDTLPLGTTHCTHAPNVIHSTTLVPTHSLTFNNNA